MHIDEHRTSVHDNIVFNWSVIVHVRTSIEKLTLVKHSPLFSFVLGASGHRHGGVDTDEISFDSVPATFTPCFSPTIR